MKLQDHPILIVDGACGTNLQEMVIPLAAWDGREGCNEILNLTAPEVITALHRGFVEAGGGGGEIRRDCAARDAHAAIQTRALARQRGGDRARAARRLRGLGGRRG